jgi:hypothetical protein
MVHDHYLDHQPKRDTNIVCWILLAIFISFFVGFFVHGAIGRAPAVQSSEAVTLMENALPSDGAPALLGEWISPTVIKAHVVWDERRVNSR